jgi:trans-feruloyl-CoA hydratase/vanillin synthase
MTYRDALYFAMTGDPFDGKKAAEMRFINKAVPREELHEEVMTLARKLAKMDSASLRATKEAFKQVVDMPYEQAFHWLQSKSNELHWIHDRQGHGGEGIDKFLAKEYRPGFGSFTDTKKD